jgi:hypothetical protein
MIRIDWAQLCEMAFLDDCDRLCMIGITTRLPAPHLPIAMRQIVIVVRIADVEAEESFGIGVSMVTPCGTLLTPQSTDGFDITVTTEYIFITLRDIPFAEEGMHRFNVAVGKSDPVSIDVPVRRVVKQPQAGGNVNHNASRLFGQASWVSGREVN